MRIDSHQHFWKYHSEDYPWITDAHAVIKRDFLPEDLSPLLKAANLNGCVAVQAMQQLGETDFLLKLAESDSSIVGVVGWVPFCDANVEDHIARYAENSKTVGFRHIIQDEPDDQFMLRSDFNDGIRLLTRYSLCYDLLIFERQLPQSFAFVDKHPELSIIVDHIAKPRIRKNEFDYHWANNIRQLAERDQVSCKLSGLVTEVRDVDWDFELLQPYFNTVLEAFGPKRLLFGSDWPVCLLRSQYEQWLQFVTSMIAPLTASEQAAIMGENAARIYQK
jgi:L-fuconolactonase